MERLAPRPVLDSLSPATTGLLYQRLTSDYRLRPYIDVVPHIRIRGLKPSIQYATYSVLNNRNELVPMYEVSAEEAQTEWVVDKRKAIMTQAADLYRPTEAAWCFWEETFFTTGRAPLLKPEAAAAAATYRDLMGNTQEHLLAYACLNNRYRDIGAYEAHFHAIRFRTNPNLKIKNSQGETPLAIMIGDAGLHEFVESLLLRLEPDDRLIACAFTLWQPAWSTLMKQMEQNHLPLLIRARPTTPHFLLKFRAMTHNSTEALKHLFAAGYQLKPQDLTAGLQNCKATIIEALFVYPSWNNLSVWLSTASETLPKEQFLKHARKFLQVRANLLRHELQAVALHPSRIQQYLAMGYKASDLSAIL